MKTRKKWPFGSFFRYGQQSNANQKDNHADAALLFGKNA